MSNKSNKGNNTKKNKNIIIVSTVTLLSYLKALLPQKTIKIMY